MKDKNYKVKAEMKSRLLASLLCVLAWGLFNSAAWAVLKVDKTVINSTTGSAVFRVSFPEPIEGDLYLATLFNGQLYFFTNSGSISTAVTPYTKNSLFVQEQVVLTLSSEGVPLGVYPFFQLVAVPGKDPLDVRSWIGGLAGLSTINITVNEPIRNTPTPSPTVTSTVTPVVTTAPTPTATVTPLPPTPTVVPTELPTPSVTPVVTPTATATSCVEQKATKSLRELINEAGQECKPTVSPSPEPTKTPFVPVLDGKALYVSTGCSSCHGVNPAKNQDHVLEGKDPDETREAINKNKGGMGQLRGLGDAELQAIASYLKGF